MFHNGEERTIMHPDFERRFPKIARNQHREQHNWPTWYFGPLDETTDQERAEIDKEIDQIPAIAASISKIRADEIEKGLRPDKFSDDFVLNAVMEGDYIAQKTEELGGKGYSF